MTQETKTIMPVVAVMGSAPSALAGPSGNRETFLWLGEPGRPGAVTEVDAW